MKEKKLTGDELRELREEVLNATSGTKTKDVKIISDGRQYSVRIPKRFIEEGEVNVKDNFFRVKLEIPEYESKEKPKLTAELIRKMKTKPHFNAKERAILQALNKSRTGLTIYEIAQITGISWVTVKKYIESLEEKGAIET